MYVAWRIDESASVRPDGTTAACTNDEDGDGCAGIQLRQEGDPHRCIDWWGERRVCVRCRSFECGVSQVLLEKPSELRGVVMATMHCPRCGEPVALGDIGVTFKHVFHADGRSSMFHGDTRS
jgi:hypothetical protein